MLHIRHLAGELLQAKFRLLTAFGTCFAARAALRRVRAFAARLPPACSERGLHLDLGEPSCFAAEGGAVHAMRPGNADATVSAHPEPTAARQEHVEALDDVLL